MTGPYAEGSIVVEFETGEPDRCLVFEPAGVPGDRWLHRLDEFDDGLDRSDVVDRYALPESDEYAASIVEVPPGESMRLGSVAAMNDRSGGGDLVELRSRDQIPDSWVVDRTTLSEFLERER